MTMPQTRHYEMKDSGVEWIGKMPKDWDIVRFKRMHRGSNVGLSLDKDYWSTNEEDTIFYTAGFKSIHTSCKDIVPEMLTKENDLLLARNGTPYVYFPCVGAIYTDHIIRVGIENGYNKAFVRYCLQQSIANEVVDTVSIATWSVPIWNRQCLPHPPLPEQTAIATYLDEKCATIDAIIAEAKASIEEYKSWKASVIFETVTKGLNPNAEMKDSGVEWIGSIPKAWQYVPLKYLASCNDEVLTEATPEDYTFDYIDIGSVHTGNGIGMCERMQFKDAPSRARRIVRDGDIIVSTVRTYLKAIAQVGNYDVPHIASTGFAVIRTKNANASFLKYALLSDNFVSQVEADSVGISYPAINATQIMAFKIPVPSIAEQTDIALYLDDKCAAIDGVIAEKEALIGELESYKKSLIFETVTGKRRVC